MRAEDAMVWDAEPAEQPLLVAPVADFWLVVAAGIAILWAVRIAVILRKQADLRASSDAAQLTYFSSVPMHAEFLSFDPFGRNRFLAYLRGRAATSSTIPLLSYSLPATIDRVSLVRPAQSPPVLRVALSCDGHVSLMAAKLEEVAADALTDPLSGALESGARYEASSDVDAARGEAALEFAHATPAPSHSR